MTRHLNPEQIEIVRTYFQTKAELQGDQVGDCCDEFLKYSTDTYCAIMTDGGGDPVYWAKVVLNQDNGHYQHLVQSAQSIWL